MKILIVGAGIGGLTLAAFLSDSGIEYEIAERSPDWSNQGYSLSLWNNGRNILRKLGLAEIFDGSGTRIKHYYVYDGKGRLLRKYDLAHFYAEYGLALNLIKRKDLHDWLFSKIDETRVTMGLSVESITQDPDKATVLFTDGRSKQYDLVVGADGIHSKVRDICFHDKVMTRAKWRVWWMWVDNKFKTESSVTQYIEPGEFVSLFDSGDKTLAIIASLSKGVAWDDPRGRIERLKRSFKDETLIVPEMFESLRDEEINPADLVHIRLKSLVRDRVVLIGDAAHGFEPHAGIGGSMALEDGYVLAAELMKVTGSYPLDRALKNYETVRKARVTKARRLTAKMEAWGQIRSRLLRRLVNIFIPYFPKTLIVKDYDALLREEI